MRKTIFIEQLYQKQLWFIDNMSGTLAMKIKNGSSQRLSGHYNPEKVEASLDPADLKTNHWENFSSLTTNVKRIITFFKVEKLQNKNLRGP